MENNLPCGCPGSEERTIERKTEDAYANISLPSQLRQWPVQIKLVSPNAPYLNGSDLLIAADCTAYAYGNFHNDFIKDRVVVVGCPKLDSEDYAERFKAILANNDIKSVTVIKMEVPCCSGIEQAAVRALRESGKTIPFKSLTVTLDGEIEGN